MSTRDMLNEITNAFKKSDGYYNGHNLPLLATYSGAETRCYNSIEPDCGPLLIINQNRQRWSTDCTITFTYNAMMITGYQTGTLYDKQYYQKIYTGVVGEFTGVVTVGSGAMDYKQHFYSSPSGYHIHKINTLNVSDPYQEVQIYCLSDDGSRLLYGMHTEEIRQLVDYVERGVWISPQKCVLCAGVGTYSGSSCPDCSGYKYLGYNAEYYLLDKRAEDVGAKRRTETEESMQWRAWAKKWYLTPTVGEIKRYVSHFLNIETGLITVTQYGAKDVYAIIEVPMMNKGVVTVGTLLSASGSTYDDIAADAEIAGTKLFIDNHYTFLGEDMIHDYCHDFSERPHTTPVTPSFGFILPQFDWGHSFGSFGSDWGTSFFYEDKYFNANSGIIYMDGTGCWQGSSLVTDTGFWTGVDATAFDYIMIYDQFFTGVA